MKRFSLTCKLLSVALSSVVLVAGSSAEDPLVGQHLEIADEFGNTHTVRIDKVDIDLKDIEGDTYLYTVSLYNPADRSWHNFCQADHEGVSKAIALTGYWDASGRHHPSDRITFACTSGVLAKCVRWGYKPWRDQPHRPLRILHQTCTRMARADYCGDGRSHTQDGTAINVFDVFGVQQYERVPDMQFEAAWGPDGAIALARGRYADAETIIAECPDKLGGCYHAEGSTLSLQQLQQQYPQALLFNESYPVQ